MKKPGGHDGGEGGSGGGDGDSTDDQYLPVLCMHGWLVLL